MESILDTIKKAIGPSASYSVFDTELIMFINSTFMILRQAGVGPREGFYIEDKSATWEDFTTDPVTANAVKTYLYAKVKKVFDPPSSSTHMKALDETINEFEWRLNFDAELGDSHNLYSND